MIKRFGKFEREKNAMGSLWLKKKGTNEG